MKSLFFILSLIVSTTLTSQCFSDRHNTSISSTWLSCEKTPNPNFIRGDSHWIRYDLGEVKKLGQAHIWNINNPEYLDAGARQILVDFSTDGQTWEAWGIWEVEKGTTSGYYEGEPGPDFDGIQARFILLTVLNSHGDDCSGFAELKVDVKDPTSIEEIDLTNQALKAHPNPAIDFTFLDINSTDQGYSTIELTDMTGRVVRSQPLKLLRGDQQVRLELSGMESGQYLLRVISAHTELTTELIVISN